MDVSLSRLAGLIKLYVVCLLCMPFISPGPCSTPEEPRECLIKRVVALEGDVIW